MQHEQRRALGLPVGAHSVIEPLGLPLGQDLRLQLGQATAHRERGVGKKYGLAVIARRMFGVVSHGMFQEVRIEFGRAIPARAGTCPATSRRARNSRVYPNQGHGGRCSRGGRGTEALQVLAIELRLASRLTCKGTQTRGACRLGRCLCIPQFRIPHCALRGFDFPRCLAPPSESPHKRGDCRNQGGDTMKPIGIHLLAESSLR